MSHRVWGASPDEWFHFDLVLGLTEDLLPVVSNPDAKISAQSRMKALGKTPSRYNPAGDAVGIPSWTDKRTQPAQIERWAQESDYGICVQTRLVRALDVDVPSLRDAERIVDLFSRALGQQLPMRTRDGTGKRLLAFTIPGDLAKRSFRVADGLVEFLATGQQFVAVGTHPSGTRYEWAGGLPETLPELSEDEFEAAWAAIVEEFAIEPERRSQRRDGAGSDLEGVDDDVATWLEANWPTFGTQGGKLFALCPWKDGHSGDSGETEAAWLLAGTGGYARGHFECLHASCSSRSDEDFLDATGYSIGQFEDLDAGEADDGAQPISGGVGQDDARGAADLHGHGSGQGTGSDGVGRAEGQDAGARNVRRSLDTDGDLAAPGDAADDAVSLYNALGGQLEPNRAKRPAPGAADQARSADVERGVRRDEKRGVLSAEGVPTKGAPHPPVATTLPLPGFLRDKQGAIEAVIENVVRAAAAPQAVGVDLMFDEFRAELMISDPGRGEWRPYRDADGVQMRVRLAAIGFKPVGREMMRDAVLLAAEHQRMDTAIMWLESLPPWDGVSRIERFWPDYFKTKDDAYTQACGLYSWTAQAGRIMEPGCKADMAVIIVGEQGARKSSGVAAISPAVDFFKEFDLTTRDENMSRKMRGVLVGELGELRGFNSRDSEDIKQWMSRQHETWTPKYLEYETKFPRRLIFYGTTNDDEFLADPTGERRSLPMRAEGVVDVDAIIRDREQLWAEGLFYWQQNGVMFREAERLARVEHSEFAVTDVWTEDLWRWLNEPDLDGKKPVERPWLMVHEVLTEGLGQDLARVNKSSEMRAAKLLAGLGYKRKQVWSDGKNAKRWVKPDET
jgi:hypothetical protein